MEIEYTQLLEFHVGLATLFEGEKERSNEAIVIAVCEIDRKPRLCLVIPNSLDLVAYDIDMQNTGSITIKEYDPTSILALDKEYIQRGVGEFLDGFENEQFAIRSEEHIINRIVSSNFICNYAPNRISHMEQVILAAYMRTLSNKILDSPDYSNELEMASKFINKKIFL